MNTWTPIWSKLPDSSIWLESKEVRILFTTMLAIKDRDHVVRYSAFELARKANLTEQEVLDSLKVLESPDTKRLEPQEFEGRRISKVEDGWLLLNGEKYRLKVREAYRREYNRLKQAEYRSNPKPDPEKPKAQKPTRDELDFYSAKIGLPPVEVEKFINHYESNGWKVGKNPMKSWEASMRNWKLNYETRSTSSGQRPVVDRNAGTLNAGRSSDYANVGKFVPVPNPERPGAGKDGGGSQTV